MIRDVRSGRDDSSAGVVSRSHMPSMLPRHAWPAGRRGLDLTSRIMRTLHEGPDQVTWKLLDAGGVSVYTGNRRAT